MEALSQLSGMESATKYRSPFYQIYEWRLLEEREQRLIKNETKSNFSRPRFFR